MNIVIYTKSGCPNCVTAKALLKAKGLGYEEWSLDDDYVASTFATLHPVPLPVRPMCPSGMGYVEAKDGILSSKKPG